VAYIFIKMANSPRPGVFVLERSKDSGETWQPWQYFADTLADCEQFFGDAGYSRTITRDDSVICSTDYSSVVPLEGGEVCRVCVCVCVCVMSYSSSTTAAAPASEVEAVVRSPTNMADADIQLLTSTNDATRPACCLRPCSLGKICWPINGFKRFYCCDWT